MNSTEYRATSTAFLIGLYTLFFIFGCAIYLIITEFFPSLDNSSSAVIVMVVAASSMAQIWTHREKSTPSGKRAWRVSALCAAVTAALLVSIALVGGIGDPQMLDELKQEGGAVVLTIASLILLVIDLLIIRLSVWVGAKLKFV